MHNLYSKCGTDPKTEFPLETYVVPNPKTEIQRVLQQLSKWNER